jgi:hypothetical protein
MLEESVCSIDSMITVLEGTRMTNPAPAKPDGEHTPLPWALNPDDRCDMAWNVEIVHGDNADMRIAFMANDPHSEANAALIVRAVNSYPRYEQMREILKSFVNAWDYNICGWNHISLISALERARKALADGTGE